MGRPSKLTAEVQSVIVEALEKGAYLETAATLAGIGKRTVFEWIERGEADDDVEPYAEFARLTKEASAKAEVASLETVRAMPQGWQAQAWFLERRFPSRYAKREPDYDLKTKQLMADLAKSELECDTLKQKLDMLKAGLNPDGQVINVLIPDALRRDGE
jgi:transposase